MKSVRPSRWIQRSMMISTMPAPVHVRPPAILAADPATVNALDASPRDAHSCARGGVDEAKGMEETGYLAAEGFEAELAHELGETLVARHGRLLLARGPAREPAWAQNIWYAPRRIPIRSIGDGAQALRAIQRNWALYDFRLHRRDRK